MISRFPKARVCISFLVVCIAIAAVTVVPARAGDDTARFAGTWQAIFPLNGQMITMRWEQDQSSYRNFVVTNTGEQPVGNGTFHAANGKYTTSAPYPNNAGVYHFIGNDAVVCVNAAGQSLTWKRYKAPGAASAPPASSPSAPAASNASSSRSPVASSRPGSTSTPPAMAANPSLPPETNAAIEAFGRKDYTTAWREFMIAAQKGDAEAQAGIGAMLLNHINPPGTGYFAQCEKWLLLSANQGNTKGMTFLAKYYSPMV